MRAAFGLVGILIGIFAIVLIWNYAYLPYTQAVLKQGQSAQSTAAQIAGVDPEFGGRATQHMRFEPVMQGNQLRALRVTSSSPAAAYESFYGIRTGDLIDQVGPQSVRDIGDFEMARSLAFEAYQRQWELRIIRNNRTYILPREARAAAGMMTPPVAPVPQPAGQTPPGQVIPPQASGPQNPPQPQVPPQQQPPTPPAQQNTNSLHRQLDAITNYGQRDQ